MTTTKSVLAQLTAWSILALRARAQLLSCADVTSCPMNGGISACKVEGVLLSEIGVANFTSALSPHPISWTVGYAPELSADTVTERKYYLGAPAGLDLERRTDLNGCALFFTGIESGLSFSNGTDTDEATASGTCADALGSTCEADLITQAQGLLGNLTASSDALQCSDLASVLQSSPPRSCTHTGTWGNITAKAITGSSSPSALQVDNCNPAGNATYSVRDIAGFPMLGQQPFSYYITPLMTIFTPAAGAGDGNDNVTGSVLTAPEVHLNCMKPVLAEPPNKMTARGDGQAVRVQKSLLSIPVAVIAVFAAAVYVA